MSPQKNDSLASSLSTLPQSQLKKAIRSLTDEDAEALLYDWSFWARPNQLPPEGNWRTWLILAGRNWGKTRTGAEFIKHEVKLGKRRIALVGRTSADCRKVMVEGNAGLLSVFPEGERPKYSPSQREITFSNGAIATTYSSEEPDLLRGPAHDSAWVDEAATFFDANVDPRVSVTRSEGTTWSNLQMGLRLGSNPRQVVTTTPRPVWLIKQLSAAETTVVTSGTTYDNRSNTPEAYYIDIISQYEGTRLGRQELNAELLEDVEGALWKREWIEATRIKSIKPRELQRIVVAIDPAVTNKATSDDTGIVVAAKGVDNRGYVLADGTCRLSSDGWANRAIGLYREYNADRIVAETNNGGDLVERVIRIVDASVPYRGVPASRGKIARAEPIAALYEQGKVSHVGAFPQLEDELCQYSGTPGEQSPNRLDALVWALSELFLEAKPVPRAVWI